MKTSELKILIEAAEQLGYANIDIFIDDGRDGQGSYIKATAELVKKGGSQDPHVFLAIRCGD